MGDRMPTPLSPVFDAAAVQQTFLPFPTGGGPSYYLPAAPSVHLNASQKKIPKQVLLPPTVEQRLAVLFHADVHKTEAAALKDDDDVSSIGSF